MNLSNWQGVCEFAAVAETESFTAAAKRLGISTAQVSRQITALEDRLGTKLFYRTTRRVSLTEAGGIYYQQCRQVLDGLEAAERAVTNLQRAPQGKIKLTAPVTYGEQYITPLINDFVLQYPALEVNLVLTNQQLDLIDEGYDLAIRLGKLVDSSLIARKLTSRSLHLCASPDYLQRQGTPFALGELEQHNCLLGTMDFWRFEESGQEKNVRVRGNLRCNSGNGLLDAALKGMGLVQLPDYYVGSHLDSGALISVLAPFQPPQEGIWALYPHNRHLSPKIRMLVDFLQAGLTP